MRRGPQRAQGADLDQAVSRNDGRRGLDVHRQHDAVAGGAYCHISVTRWIQVAHHLGGPIHIGLGRISIGRTSLNLFA
jgi:hypothetical protein